VESNNPYRVSEEMLESIEGSVNVHHVTGARAVRERHINTEVSIQQIGRLYWIGGLATIGVAIVTTLVEITSVFDSVSPDSHELAVVVIAVMIGMFGWLHVLVGRRLQDLDRRVRVLASVLALLQLTIIPLGTVVGLLLLILLWSPQGRYVFTDEYASARALTPGLRPRTSVGCWLLLLGVVAVVVAVGVVSMWLG
jgi:hypothetical protein